MTHENGVKTVLMVSPYFPPRGGGLEQYVKQASALLGETKKYKVVVLTSGEKNGVDTCTNVDGITVYALAYRWSLSNTPFDFMWWRKVRRVIKEVQPDVINVHTPVPGIGDIAAMRRGNIPLVVTYHTASMKKGRYAVDLLIRLYELFPMRWMLRKAAHVITSSDAIRLEFLGGYKNKSTTITPGVDGSQFAPDAHVRTIEPTLLFVAGLGAADSYKGLGILIKALKKVRETYPRVRLVVAGDGEKRLEYECTVRELGLQDVVDFRGYLSRKALRAAYQEAHIFVLPTSYDSAPLVITEAMASGLPVVSTRVGDIPGMVADGESGYLIEPNDTPALVHALQKLLANPAHAEKLGVAGREKVLREFNWGDRIKTYDSILETSMNKKPHIVMLTGYFPPHIGGVEKVAQVTAELLAERQYPVTVLTSSCASQAGIEVASGVTVTRLRTIEFAHTPISPGLLFQLLRVSRKSIFHLHLAQAFWPETLLAVALVRRMPYVVHFHLDVRPSGFFGVLFLAYKKIVWGPLLRHAQQVIVLTDEQAAFLRDTYRVRESSITIIPNGVDESFFSSRSYTPSGVFQLISVGRLAPQKRLERLIDAMAQVSVPAHLTLVGDGEEEEKLRAQVVALGLTSVTFVGRKTPTEIQKIMIESDAMVISSEHEGMPLAVLEAMAAGMPIIGSRVPGIQNLLQDVGMLVDEPYAEGFAHAIHILAKDLVLQRKLGDASSEKARSYAWPRVIDALEAVYKKML